MDFINIFSENKGEFCFLSNLSNYLNYYGMDVSEAWLGAAIGYMGFYHCNDSRKDMEIIHGRSGDFKLLFQKLQSQLAKPLECINVDVDSAFKSIISDMLIRNDLLLIWINDFYLEYSAYFNQKQFWRLIVLLEIRESEVIIYDNEVKVLDLETFMKSVNCDGKNIVYYSSEKCIRWENSEIDAVKNGLIFISNRLLNRVYLDDYNYGVNGFKNFIEVLRKTSKADEIYNYYFEISRPGGLTVIRQTMGSFFEELNLKYPLINTENCKQIYNNLHDSWRKIAGLLFKLSANGDEDLKERIIIRIYKTIDLELEGIQAIKQLIDNL